MVNNYKSESHCNMEGDCNTPSINDPWTDYVNGYEAFRHFLRNTKLEQYHTFLVFGSGPEEPPDPDVRSFWCPDVRQAMPILEECFTSITPDPVDDNKPKAQQNSNEPARKPVRLVYISVGPREYWKDPNNAFRTDKEYKLTAIPTLMHLPSHKRLVDVHCKNMETVRDFITDILDPFC